MVIASNNLDPAFSGTLGASALPAKVEMILSAMDSGQYGSGSSDRRAAPRLSYRVRGLLSLFVDDTTTAPRVLYTRNVSARGLGFISEHRLPLGYGGFIEFAGPDGRPLRVQCTLHRCREAAPGWFEGALCFNREQADFLDLAGGLRN